MGKRVRVPTEKALMAQENTAKMNTQRGQKANLKSKATTEEETPCGSGTNSTVKLRTTPGEIDEARSAVSPNPKSVEVREIQSPSALNSDQQVPNEAIPSHARSPIKQRQKQTTPMKERVAEWVEATQNRVNGSKQSWADEVEQQGKVTDMANGLSCVDDPSCSAYTCKIGVRECVNGVCKCCFSLTCDAGQESVDPGRKVLTLQESSN
ncbi:uncharacterized protein LOC132641897 [Lycium barbarum]|uniref:uncharacterized protein LOC132641897 n=1 Tax=Lycium barbarum TaxID=112863 RepID=UPI00293EFD1D|nr:uncharacterized protein LOC132641897 [Lycium barbarum]